MVSADRKDALTRRFEEKRESYLKVREQIFQEKMGPGSLEGWCGGWPCRFRLGLAAMRPSQSEIDAANAAYLSLGQDAVPS